MTMECKEDPLRCNGHGYINHALKIALLVPFLFIGTIGILPSTVSSSDVVMTKNVSSAEDGDICYTKTCNDTANAILRNMDPEVDPCNNFFKYACGNFLNTTDFSRFTMDYDLFIEEQVKKQLNRSLSEINNMDKKSHRLVKNLYKSCMDTEKLEEIGIRDIAMKMKTVGGWPLVVGNGWNETNFSWLDTTSKLNKFGLDLNFIYLNLMIDDDFPNYKIVMAQQMWFSHTDKVPKKQYEKYINAFNEFIVGAAEEFGVTGIDNATEEISQILLFERNLQTVRDSQDTGPVEMTVFQLNKIFPEIPWLEFINEKMPASITIGREDIVFVENLNYHTKLISLLTQTPKRTIANYIMTRVIFDMAPLLNKKMRELRQAFVEPFFNITLSQRWQECLLTAKIMKKVIQSIYIRDYYNKETNNEVLEMTKNLKTTLADILNQINRMEPETKQYIQSKFKEMFIYTPYSKDILDDQKLDDYYDNLNLSADTYLENRLNLNKFYRKKAYEKLKTSNVTLECYPNRLINNPEVCYGMNSISIPAAIIHDAYFHKDLPKYVNYGALGSKIAGKLFLLQHDNEDWRNPREEWDGNPAFTKANSSILNTTCIIDQYSQYRNEISATYLDGQWNLKTSIEDNSGTKLAYKVYQKWAKVHGPEKKLPGINRSPNQLFWLIFANTLCETHNKHYDKKQLVMDEATPNNIRVFGSLVNSLEFAKDYECSPSTPMNSTQFRCDIY